MSKKRSHTEELIAKPLIVNDEEVLEKLLNVLDGPKVEIKPNPNIRTISVEELHEVINKAAKDIYEKEWKK